MPTLLWSFAYKKSLNVYCYFYSTVPTSSMSSPKQNVLKIGNYSNHELRVIFPLKVSTNTLMSF